MGYVEDMIAKPGTGSQAMMQGQPQPVSVARTSS
jgi:hypothetical protein